MNLFNLFIDDFTFNSLSSYNFIEGKDNYYYFISAKEKPDVYIQGKILIIKINDNNKFTVTLPKSISDNIKCDYEDEVLKITIPKQKIKKIEY